MPRRPLLLFIFLLQFDETDRSLLGLWRVHELADGLDDAGDGLVVGGELALELRELLPKLLVRYQRLTQLDEGAHHVDGHLYRARAVEHGGGHDGTVLGEDQWALASAAPA